MTEIKKLKEKSTIDLNKFSSKDNILAIAKLIVFFSILFIFYLISTNDIKILYYIELLLIVTFFVLLNISSKISSKILFIKNKISVCNEVDEKYINKTYENNYNLHEYCLDLDIVGKNSLLAYLDKTQSKNGFIKLEHDLLNVIIEKDKIVEKQNAIQELASKIEWCIKYLTTARKNEKNYEFKFLSFDEKFKKLKKIIWLFSVLNFIAVVWFVFLPLSFYSISLLLFPISIYIIFYFLYKRKIKKQFKIANFSAKRVGVFQELLMIVENEDFNSKKLIELKTALFNKNHSASSSINKLYKLLDLYENRRIPVVGLLANIIFLWDLQVSIKIESHLMKINSEINTWLEVLSEIEATVCFGIYAYKNNNYVYPKISDKKGFYNFCDIIHPLIDNEIGVKNDLFIQNRNSISIVTGANMTGKSTFLRTIGANLVLAMNGCPVPAKEFEFYPSNIFSSMRTNDSLFEGSSFFNAEITKLKRLIDKLNNGEYQFIILDEILKGTNSVDKLNGSKLFIEKLIHNKTDLTCIIATHDIDLTKMAIEYKENISNLCFELHNFNGELTPDYKLRKGVTTTMNAIRLMREYKIID
jgi:DNA mismatch repair ATPase MutS